MPHCIVYFSSARQPLQEADLLTILDQSRRTNIDAHITGVLLFVQGSIVQVLEGEEAEVVAALYERIERDERHMDVTQVVNCPVGTRSFGDWSMGYKTLTMRQLELVKTLIELQDADWLRTKPSCNIILNMLKLFYENSQYN